MNDELIVRVLSGTASPTERETADLWRREAPENEAYFQATLRAWTATAPARQAREDDHAFVQAVLDEADTRTGAFWRRTAAGGRARRAARVLSPRRAVALAAAVAAVALGFRIALRSHQAETLAVWEADSLQPRTIVLGDGSVVRVAPGGRLTRLASGDERRFTLEGKAFFAVAHDAEHPFVVEVGPVSVRDLGTRFEIDPDSGRVRTVVLEGRVSVSNPHGSVAVDEGGVAVAPPDGVTQVAYRDDVEGLLDWPGGVLIFQATPLDRVAHEVGRHFGKIVTIRDPAIRSRTITAWFGTEGFGEVMEAICQAAAVPCALTDSTATVGAR
ncbi:MAG: FecR domain-containing protein [Gemmatimonadetes bacterium]|nr:FecR domain-containing protein [Gemmatimonadota bacterium]